MNFKQIFVLGIALFAMFFGAGNVVFPLDLGRIMGDQVGFAIIGLFLSAVLMPLVGICAGALFEGDYRSFFGRLGYVPGEILAFFCMVLIGPFGAIPRTITLSHASLAWYFPQLPLWLFSIVGTIIVFFFTIRRGKVVEIIGRYLGPLKIILLSAIIISGFFVTPSMMHTDFTAAQSFFSGLVEGYNTLDLLGAVFFSRLIFLSLSNFPYASHRELIRDLMKAGSIGALLLGFVYAGFMITSASHGGQITFIGRDQLICAVADYLLGRLGVLAGFTVAAACLTTAIALTAVFADYLSTVLLRNKLPYVVSVLASVVVTGALANLGFNGIMRTIEPIIFILYPAIIVLSILNIAYKTTGFKPVKIPVYLTLVFTIARYIGLF